MRYSIEQIDKIQIHFIVAKARTGSSLLTNVLGHHPNILSISEKPFAYFLHSKYSKIETWTNKIINSYCKDFYLFSKYNLFAQLSNLESIKELLLEYQNELNYARVIRLTSFCFFPEKDKSSVNIILFKELDMGQYLIEASKIFPNSKFILLYRNPFDNIARVRSQEQKQGRKHLSIIRNAIDWKNHYNQFLEKKSLLPKNRILEIFYEQFILETESELKQICVFFNIQYDLDMLAYSMTNKKIDLPLQKIDPKHKMSKEDFTKMHEGLFKKPDKTKIGAWKNELTGEEANVIWKICSKTAVKVGYKEEKDINDCSLGFPYFMYLIRYFFRNRLIVLYWYKLPFFIQRTIKVVKNKFGLRYM